jgi:hypothetical protein
LSIKFFEPERFRPSELGLKAGEATENFGLSEWNQSRLSSGGHLHNFLLDGVGHQLGFVVDVQLAHQIELVGFDSLDAQLQNACNLTDRVSFG